jgi:pre-60S factor REI1
MGRDPKLRDFFDLSSDEEEKPPHNPVAVHVSGSHHQASHDRSRKRRPLKRSENCGSDNTATSLDQASSTPTLPIVAGFGLGSSQTPSRSLVELSIRAMKQEYTLNNQLAKLRADDRRSLSHLPPAQQRALLLTQHKQTENARRLEQTYRGNLESAGNKFNCLGKIRLIRKPPHTGNVHSLNR